MSQSIDRDNQEPETDPNTPLRLAEAVRLAFPHGGMTVSGLRREALRGRLAIERIAGKDFTTLAAIEAMREKCRVQPQKLIDYSPRPRPIEKHPSVAKEAFLQKIREQKAARTGKNGKQS